MEETKKETSVIDPDYYFDLNEEPPSKKIKDDHDNEKHFAIQKIEKIIDDEFNAEINNKQNELEEILKRIGMLQEMLDKLRACAASSFYCTDKAESQIKSLDEQPISGLHPTIKSLFVGKTTKDHPSTEKPVFHVSDIIDEASGTESNEVKNIIDQSNDQGCHVARLKDRFKVIVGNVSRFIPPEKRENNDLSTHKWMVYVRTPKDHLPIEKSVSKVLFFLHPSYKPNDLVEVSNPPFHLTRRGWGEFPVRVQLYFHENRNKNVDVIHNLKLDKTFTGLQTLGAETIADLLLFKSSNEIFQSNLKSSLNVEEDEISADAESFVENESNVTICEDPPKLVNGNNFDDGGESVSSSKAAIDSKINTKTENENCLPLIEGLPEDVANNSFKAEPTVSEQNAKFILSLKTANGNMRKFYKCKDKAGDIILIPVESLSALNSKASGTNHSVNVFNCQNLNNPKKLINNHCSENQTSLKNGYSFFLNGKQVDSRLISSSSVAPKGNKVDHKVSILKPKNLGSYILSATNSSKHIPSSKSRDFSIYKKNTRDGSIIYTDSHNRVIDNSWRHQISAMQHFHELFYFLARKFPIIMPDGDKMTYHYCCKCEESFLSWPVEKQRACEWQRARFLAKVAKIILKKGWNKCITPENIYSTKKLLVFCRKFALVPTKQNDQMEIKKHDIALDDLINVVKSSTTDPEDIISNLKAVEIETLCDKTKNESEDEEVDIVGSAVKIDPGIIAVNEKKDPDIDDIFLPSVFQSSFINHLSTQIGVNFEALEVVPGVKSCVLQDMLFKVCQRFTEDLIRGANASSYEEFGTRHVKEISVSDVVMSVLNNPVLDFLTPKNFGSDSTTSLAASNPS